MSKDFRGAKRLPHDAFTTRLIVLSYHATTMLKRRAGGACYCHEDSAFIKYAFKNLVSTNCRHCRLQPNVADRRLSAVCNPRLL